jgi:hypothetical protein
MPFPSDRSAAHHSRLSLRSWWPSALAVVPAVLVACGASATAPVLDAGPPDGGPSSQPDAAADGASGPAASITVDFTTALYPALTRKLGFNTNWNTVGGQDLAAADVAAAAGVPIVSGLVETKLGPGDFPGDTSSVFYPQPLFYRDGQGAIQSRTSPNLSTLRQRVHAGGMVNFLQLAGMPCATSESQCVSTPGLFTVDPSAEKTDGGNWYPLPVPSQVSEMAGGLAGFARNVAADGVPTMWALWQEPDHTLSLKLSKEDSVHAYLDLYKAFARAVRSGDPDAVVTGPAQNQATGTNLDHSIDGAGYNSFVTNQGSGVGEGAAVPLDYVTIQNYKGSVSTLETIQNTRIAYADDRFNRSPVMFNEWDIDKSKKNGFDENYNTAEGVVAVLDQVAIMLDQPDLAYALVMRGIFAPNTPPLVLAPLRFLGAMSPHRRRVDLGAGFESLSAIAAGDRDGAALLVWNHDTQERVVSVDLRSLPSALVGANQALVVETMADAAPRQVSSTTLVTPNLRLDALHVPARGVVMIHVGTGPTIKSGIVAAKYARHLQWCDRLGPTSFAAPHGMGAYDVRSSSLVASVDGKDGVGLAGVVLRGVPAAYSLQVTLTKSGLPLPVPSVAVAVRVDFMKGDQSLRTIVYRDADFSATPPPTTLVNGATLPPVERTQAFAEGVTRTLPITDDAPPGWGPERRVMVSLVLAGAPSASTVVARLREQ